MKKIVWTTFGIALVLVNVIAEVGAWLTGIEVPMLLRIALIGGVTLGMTVLAGAFVAITQLDEEKPLSGRARDSLSADRRKT